MKTDKLYNELKESATPSDFIKENEQEFQQESVQDFLMLMLKKYNLERKDVIIKAGLASSYAYQIFDGRKNAGRDKLIQLSFGFPLDMTEVNKLLSCGGYRSLYIRSKRDALIMFAINKNYNVIKLNELLEENGEELLY